MANRLQHIEQRLSTLRNVIDDLLVEVRAAMTEPAPPRKRRNLKVERMMQFSESGWSKPKELRKSARKATK